MEWNMKAGSHVDCATAAPGAGRSVSQASSHAVHTATLREELLLLSSCRREETTKIAAVFSGRKSLKNATGSRGC